MSVATTRVKPIASFTSRAFRLLLWRVYAYLRLDWAHVAGAYPALLGILGLNTAIVIAHPLSPIPNADWISVLDQGRIVEQGRHADLLARQGIYAELHARQFVDLASGI